MYLTLVLSAALGGYLVVLALPLGALILGLSALGGLVGTEGLGQAWPGVLGEATAAGLLGWASYALLRHRIPVPTGIALEPHSALMTLVEQLGGQLHGPWPHRLLIVTTPEIRLVRTPQRVLWPRLSDSLLIGLPLLLTSSPETLRVLLAQRLGELRYGLRQAPGWIALLVDAWEQLAASLTGGGGLGPRLAHRIAAGYARRLRRVAGPALCQAELLSGRTALEILDDGQVKAAVTQHALVSHILERVFWPYFWGLATRHPTPPSGPLGLMASSVAEQSTPEHALRRITALMDERQKDARPTLRERLQSLGHRVPDLPPPLEHSAAEEFLGEEARALVDKLDQQWLESNAQAWQSRYRRAKERLRDSLLLLRKAKAGTLSTEESWTFARLVHQRIKDRRKAAKLFKRVLAANPLNAQTQFLAGQCLLEYGDKRGVRAMLRAAELDPALRPQASNLISHHLGLAGRGPSTLGPPPGLAMGAPGTA